MQDAEDIFADHNQEEASLSVSNKRPSSPNDSVSDLGPPSPKRAGLEVTVNVEGDESTNKTKHAAKPHSPKKEAKSPPKKVRQGTDDSAEKAALRLKLEKQEEGRLKMKVLVSNFTEDQLDRYEMFRRAAFPKAAVRRLMQSISGATIPQNVVIAMAGIAKVYVGEIVEEALDAMEKTNGKGPIQPKHIRESVRKLRARGIIVNTKYKKKLF